MPEAVQIAAAEPPRASEPEPVRPPAESRIWIWRWFVQPEPRATSIWEPSGAHAIGQPERAATLTDTSDPGVATGRGVATGPGPVESVRLGPVDWVGPADASGVASAEALAAESGVASSVTFGEGDSRAVLLPVAAGAGDGRSRGSSTPKPTTATRHAASATGTRNRAPEPRLKPPRRPRTPPRIGC